VISTDALGFEQLDAAHQNDPMIDFHQGRFEFLDKVESAWHTMVIDDMPQAQDIVKKLAQKLRAMYTDMQAPDQQALESAQEYLMGLIKDVEGEVRLAVGRKESFEWWGRHYLPSLMNAHEKQVVNNYKDWGIQKYSSAMFDKLRDSCKEAFLDTRPKDVPVVHDQPHSQQQAHAQQAQAQPQPQQLDVYYDAGGGCFHGDSLISMADGSTKAISTVRRGDCLSTGARVIALIKIACVHAQTPLVRLNDGLLITPSHPVWVAGADATTGKWVKPHRLAAPRLYSCNAVYNLVLDSVHVAEIGGVQCVTLGHGKTGEGVEHAYFGSQKVIDDLKAVSEWHSGFAEIAMTAFLRDEATHKICGLRV